MNSRCSFSQYHLRICSVIRVQAKPNRLTFTMARPSPEHVISSSRTGHRPGASNAVKKSRFTQGNHFERVSLTVSDLAKYS